jgi:hypothetical protein
LFCRGDADSWCAAIAIPELSTFIKGTDLSQSIKFKTGKFNLMTESITLQIPDPLYQRLASTAQANHRPMEEVVLHSLKVGSPPAWDNVPEEFQSDLAALDRLEDEALWKIAQARKANSEMTRYEALLQKNQDHTRLGRLSREKSKLGIIARLASTPP